ncbi:GNAT family N-acetyltransferase [Sagittula sp. NFXS13]|uniref:GNAT family N-acetyltransferase n=1 Tax=Sagittula sp. NFXS13 TaxID=2819095 RepID=UPI0032DF53E1
MTKPDPFTPTTPGPDVPRPNDPQPEAPVETPPDMPQEVPGTPAPDMPGQTPPEVPDDLPRGPGHEMPDDVPTQPDAPVEVPDAPNPDLPPQERPTETPGISDPTPQAPPQEIPTNPGPTGAAPDPSKEIRLRPANPLDAGRLGDIITQATLAAKWKPRLHNSVEDIAHAGQMIDKGWITVAELDHQTAGFIAREDSYVHCLFIAEEEQGRGVGAALLDDAKAAQDRLELWTFQTNTDAQRFYRREGFELIEETDGSANDEGLPDVKFLWQRATAKTLTAPTSANVKRPKAKAEASPQRPA